MNAEQPWSKHHAINELEKECTFKVTIEFGNRIVADKQAIPVSDIKKIINKVLESTTEHPLCPIFYLYMDALRSDESVLKDDAQISRKITLGFGDCGDCNTPTGHRGLQCYSTECGIHSCLAC